MGLNRAGHRAENRGRAGRQLLPPVSLLIDVTIGDKSERKALEQALEDAAEDYEAAAAEAAAKRRADQLRKELEAVCSSGSTPVQRHTAASAAGFVPQ